MGEPDGEASTGGQSRTLGDLDPEVVAGMTADELKKFIDTGRTGRRNALHDVSQPDNSSTAGVAEALQSLNVQSDASSSSSTKPPGEDSTESGASGGS